MMESIVPTATFSKKSSKFCAFCIIGYLTFAQQVVSFGGIPPAPTTRTRQTSAARYRESRISPARSSSLQFPLLFSNPSDEENPEDKNLVKHWDHEESLLVMNLSPLPNVAREDSLSRISQYIQSFPFAAVLPVQPLQALPTDDGGLELKFLRKKTQIKSGVDGGVRFFVHFRDEQPDSIEVIVKRNSEGQYVPKMFAEKLICTTFVKGMALGSDDGKEEEPSSVKVPNTRIESPTKDMAKIESVFHKWI